MPREIIDFKIPEWAVCPLIYGDMSACNDDDEKKINDFCARVISQYGNANFIADTSREDYNRGFCYSNDIDKLGSDCVTLIILSDNI